LAFAAWQQYLRGNEAGLGTPAEDITSLCSRIRFKFEYQNFVSNVADLIQEDEF